MLNKLFSYKAYILTMVERSTCFQNKMEHFENECLEIFPWLSDFLAKNDDYGYHISLSYLYTQKLETIF